MSVRSVTVRYLGDPSGAVAAARTTAAANAQVATTARTANAQTAGMGAAGRRAAAGLSILNPKILGPAGLIVGFSAAASAGIEFESSQAKLRTQIGLTATESDKAAEAARRIGAETGRGAQEAIDASFFIHSAGLRGAEAMEALERSSQAARIGLGETAEVADLVTSAMNAYGPEVLSAAQATDDLVGIVREGKAEAPQLVSAIGQVLPVASEMGVAFDEVGAAIASMTRTGTDAGTAGMQLRQILAGLLNPAEGVRDAMAEMGLSADGLRATIREDGLWAALMELREATGGNEEALGRLFPNVRSLAGFLDMTGANAEETEQIFGRLADTTGMLDDAIDDVATTTQDKLNRVLAELRDDFHDVSDAAGDSVGNIAGAFLWLRDLLGDYDLGETWARGAGAVGEFDGSMTDAEASMRAHISAANDVRSALDDVGDGADGTADSVAGLEEAVESYNDTMRAMVDPIFGARKALKDFEDAQRDVEDAQSDLQALIDDGKRGTEEYEEAVRDLNQALEDEVSAAFNAESALTDLLVAVENNEVSADSLDDALDRLIDSMGLSERAADRVRDMFWELVGAMDAVPDEVRTSVGVDGAEATMNALRRIRAAALDIPTQRSLTVTTLHREGAAPSGGEAVARARGGPLDVGQLALVGEEGPEFFVPDTAGTVIPADVTAAMLRPAPQGAPAARGGDGAAAGFTYAPTFQTMPSAEEHREAMVRAEIAAARMR